MEADADSDTMSKEDEAVSLTSNATDKTTMFETIDLEEERKRLSGQQSNVFLAPDTLEIDEVIDLVKMPVGDRKCINYLCQSGVNLVTPPGFCLAYYRVQTDNGRNQKVCEACYDVCVLYYDKVYEATVEEGDIMEVDAPLRDETFSIIDSDSEGEEKVEEEFLDVNTVKMLGANLDIVLEETKQKYKLEERVNLAIQHIQKKTEIIDESHFEVKTMVNSIRKEVDGMLMGLFGTLRVDNKNLPDLSIVDMDAASPGGLKITTSMPKPKAEEIVKSEPMETDTCDPPPFLPPRGPQVKPPLKTALTYYVKRNTGACSWTKAVLEKIIGIGSKINNQVTTEVMYFISRESNTKVNSKNYISGKEIAYCVPSQFLLEVGARVIALFKEYGDIKTSKKDAYYPGVVAESPSKYNKFRYLIFFDDGYAHYVVYNNVFLIFESSEHVWEDVGPDSRTFIKKYLSEYPNRSMVKILKNQSLRTEFRGKWYPTTVLNIDCSLVQIFFDSLSKVEWIYRGSRRLSIIYKEEQAANNRMQYKQRFSRTAVTSATPNAPYVQYSRDDQEIIDLDQSETKSLDNGNQKRSVAIKSTRPTILPPNRFNDPNNTERFLPTNKTDGPPGKIVYYTPRKHNPSSKTYRPHRCSEVCQNEMHTTLQRVKGYGPLAKPILCGFYRIHYKLKNKRTLVVYKTPCGKMVRNMDELHFYLRQVKSDLTVDLFSFDFNMRCLAEFHLEPKKVLIKDLSNGCEEIQIPVVNYVDNELNDFVNYSTVRMPTDGVTLNLDPEFLVGCDCEDDCIDKTKCNCWQLTLQGKKYLNQEADDIGYKHRRLNEQIFTGIYECNSRCKCAKTCLNRVVQNPLAHKLQVFRTVNRGWGIRCINDIPKGSFVCIYAGALLTDQMANEGGKNYGDEYLAELDYIENVETGKEDYEEDAYNSDKEEDSIHDDDDEDDTVSTTEKYSYDKTGRKVKNVMDDNDFICYEKVDNGDTSGIRTRLRKRTVAETLEEDKKKNVAKKVNVGFKDDETVTISDDEEVREPSNFNPANDDLEKKSKYVSVREMFGKDENIYIMDAKNTGNIGRYLNHSCSPNIFVQNVFVDTHDLRFPWVSFFASVDINAGTELTWNYHYDIGSVQGKIMYCHCGSSECKGRLL